jgi:hypothetical protein
MKSERQLDICTAGVQSDRERGSSLQLREWHARGNILKALLNTQRTVIRIKEHFYTYACRILEILIMYLSPAIVVEDMHF